MSVASKVHLVRQVMSSLCKGPVFDTVWSKVGTIERAFSVSLWEGPCKPGKHTTFVVCNYVVAHKPEVVWKGCASI